MSTDGAESEMDTCPIVNDTIETSIRELVNESDSAAVPPTTTTRTQGEPLSFYLYYVVSKLTLRNNMPFAFLFRLRHLSHIHILQ